LWAAAPLLVARHTGDDRCDAIPLGVGEFHPQCIVYSNTYV
jgi:hypothetical protein